MGWTAHEHRVEVNHATVFSVALLIILGVVLKDLVRQHLGAVPVADWRVRLVTPEVHWRAHSW